MHIYILNASKYPEGIDIFYYHMNNLIRIYMYCIFDY